MSIPRPPVELDWLTEPIGAEGVLALIEQAGGTRLYVPHEARESSELSRLLDVKRAQALAARYGGDYIRVPLCKEWRARVYHARGMSAAEIARRLNCLDNTVWRMLRRRADDRQPCLPLPTPATN